MPRTASIRPLIDGYVAAGFETVRDEFERNFIDRGELGAACAIYHRGQKVVDLWGGHRCPKTAQPWQADTISLAFSVTKGMAAAAMVVAHGRGLFELDAPVADYWPEFAQHGKGQITVRQLLAHQAGLVGIDRQLTPAMVADHDLMAQILAEQRPLWQPATRHGYHTLTLGWYQNELIRRVDPQRRSLAKFFQAEIADRLGIHFYIGVPAHVASDRISTIIGFHKMALLAHLNQLPWRMVLSGAWPRSVVAKSINFLRFSDPATLGNPEFRDLEIPSANGFGEARAIAKVYDVLCRGGRELRLALRTHHELLAPTLSLGVSTRDAVLKIDTNYHFGFSRPSDGFRFGSDDRAFGCPGAGGSFAMADPAQQLSFAYLTNKMGFRLFDDVREKAVRDACYRCVEVTARSQLESFRRAA
jgi:CubicO group peptidase (beta-lactamase class C family)